MPPKVIFAVERSKFHQRLSGELLGKSKAGVPHNADSNSKSSIRIASAILERLGATRTFDRVKGQTVGSVFEIHCKDFVESCFHNLGHLRSGSFSFHHSKKSIADFSQYMHLKKFSDALKSLPELKTVLGADYLITPDVIVARELVTDDVINSSSLLVDDTVAKKALLRAAPGRMPILHASISCKWTLRSDRAQNARSEALNLIRGRKGPLPHTVVVTAEPSPGRLASLALGTGDIDCVYHFALYELEEAVKSVAGDDSDSWELLRTMVDGQRLKDITDLPLDLAA